MTNNIPLQRTLFHFDGITAHVDSLECMPRDLFNETKEMLEFLEHRVAHYSAAQSCIDDVVSERGE